MGAGEEQKGGVLLDFLSVTLKTLVASGEDEQYLLDDFAGCLRHSDIKYFTIKAMLAIVKERRPEAKNAADRFTDNAAKLLLAVKLPNGNSAKGQKELAALKPLVLDSGFRLNYESASKLYSDTWLLLLSFKVTPAFNLKPANNSTNLSLVVHSSRSSRTRRSWPRWIREYCRTSRVRSVWPTF